MVSPASRFDDDVEPQYPAGWTVALLSETIMHSSVKPTVLEWLVFWMAAAMQLPGSYVPPVRFAHTPRRSIHID